MLNTFEHGYSDAIRGHQRIFGSEEYRKGYEAGARYRADERRMVLIGTSFLIIVMFSVLFGQMAEMIVRAV